MGITSWIVKNKTKEVIKGILEGICEFWYDITMKNKRVCRDNREESELHRTGNRSGYPGQKEGLRRIKKQGISTADSQSHKLEDGGSTPSPATKDPTKVMRGY